MTSGMRRCWVRNCGKAGLTNRLLNSFGCKTGRSTAAAYEDGSGIKDKKLSFSDVLFVL